MIIWWEDQEEISHLLLNSPCVSVNLLRLSYQISIIIIITIIIIKLNLPNKWYLSKEVGKQYFRVTNDFYLMQLTMMKGGRSQNNT